LVRPILIKARKQTRPRTIDPYEVFLRDSVSVAHGLPVAAVAAGFPEMAHGVSSFRDLERRWRGKAKPAGAGLK
jgi:hypothetical protein